MTDDRRTADAFAKSWNDLPSGSIYSFAQFEDWLAPITRREVEGKSVLELGCGNGSLLVHLAKWLPSQITGVDLGASTEAAQKNMRDSGYKNYSILQADLTEFSSAGFDLVLCIGVLHHLADPATGFEAVITNAKPGGKFHCWVYAREGNSLIVHFVDPLRRFTSRLPWVVTKHLIASPLAALYFCYAKVLRQLRQIEWLQILPLYEYSLWIAQRPYAFFRHVAFDQLVSPRTAYIDRKTVDAWLGHPKILPGSAYVFFRNANSWKFGGSVR
jgi:2-polyprenyl-3-methyl-5-hydroxy-6-metoxy-1,4-benzoquinol methylase